MASSGGICFKFFLKKLFKKKTIWQLFRNFSLWNKAYDLFNNFKDFKMQNEIDTKTKFYQFQMFFYFTIICIRSHAPQFLEQTSNCWRISSVFRMHVWLCWKFSFSKRSLTSWIWLSAWLWANFAASRSASRLAIFVAFVAISSLTPFSSFSSPETIDFESIAAFSSVWSSCKRLFVVLIKISSCSSTSCKRIWTCNVDKKVSR